MLPIPILLSWVMMMAIFKGTKYDLTATELKKLARLCDQEQGSVAGCAAEASLMANLYELVGKSYGSLYSYVRNGKWFSQAAYWMDNGSCTSSELAAVKDVLVNGNRTVPLYIDEHDCFEDIEYIKVNGKKYTYKNNKAQVKNKSNYIKDKTIIRNNYDSTYTFYCFPAPGADPFGYTNNKRAPKSGSASKPADSGEIYVDLSIRLPQISEGSKGKAVQIWESIIQVAVTGTFDKRLDEATKMWQNKQGLTADGIVGPKTWRKGFETI